MQRIKPVTVSQPISRSAANFVRASQCKPQPQISSFKFQFQATYPTLSTDHRMQTRHPQTVLQGRLQQHWWKLCFPPYNSEICPYRESKRVQDSPRITELWKANPEQLTNLRSPSKIVPESGTSGMTISWFSAMMDPETVSPSWNPWPRSSSHPRMTPECSCRKPGDTVIQIPIPDTGYGDRKKK